MSFLPKKLTLQMLNDPGFVIFLVTIGFKQIGVPYIAFLLLYTFTEDRLLPINLGAYFVHRALISKHTLHISIYPLR